MTIIIYDERGRSVEEEVGVKSPNCKSDKKLRRQFTEETDTREEKGRVQINYEMEEKIENGSRINK